MKKQRTIRRGVLLAVFLAGVWLAAAAIRPDSTFHLAPLLIAGAAPVATTEARSLGFGAIAAAASLTISLVSGSLLSIGGRLQGPTLLPYGGAYAEAISFAAVGALAGVFVVALARIVPYQADV